MYKNKLKQTDIRLAASCSEKTAVIFLPFRCSDLQHRRRHFSCSSRCIPQQGHLRYTQTNPFIPTQQLQTSQCDATQKGEVAHCQQRETRWEPSNEPHIKSGTTPLRVWRSYVHCCVSLPSSQLLPGLRTISSNCSRLGWCQNQYHNYNFTDSDSISDALSFSISY